MRLPDDAILARLQRVWEAYPSLRLGQLIGNALPFALGDAVDPFYLTDEEFIGAIEKAYGQFAAQASEGEQSNG